MTEPQSSPPHDGGWIHGLVNSVKGLTLTNIIVILILVVAAIPAYTLYRVLNDETMLYRFLSSYREVPNPIPDSNCTLREVSMRGGGDTWGISTNFASLGNDRWQIGVTIGHSPSTEDIETYCAVLNSIIDFMRKPHQDLPVSPGTNEPLIWKYKFTEDQCRLMRMLDILDTTKTCEKYPFSHRGDSGANPDTDGITSGDIGEPSSDLPVTKKGNDDGNAN
jgi:hypothetical protein